MYALVNSTPFKNEMELKTLVLYFPPIFASDGKTKIPYTCEQMLKIITKYACKKSYHDTACNIYHVVYDVLDTHIDDAFKVVPSTVSPIIGWNALISLNDIFDQLMKTYGCPTLDTMQQNMTMFLSPYNPQDPPEILFKQCADCQEIVIITNVKYTNEQLLMNVINLLTQCGLYQQDLEYWDCKPNADKTWHNLHPFIQEAHQNCLHLGTMTARQGGYSSQNRFAGFTTMAKEYASNNDTAKTIAGSINSYFANLSAQMTASIKVNTSQVNASLHLQQLANNNTQLQQQLQSMMQQMVLLLTNTTTTHNNAYGQPPTQIYTPTHLQGFKLQYQQWGGGCGGGGHSCGGCPWHGHSGGGREMTMPPNSSMGGNVIPYILAGVHPTQQQERVHFSNTVKDIANQNVCYTIGFDVEDWHTSASCN
jgi:hypothetical protein